MADFSRYANKAKSVQFAAAAASSPYSSSSSTNQKPASNDPEIANMVNQLVTRGHSIGKYMHKFRKLDLPVSASRHPQMDFPLGSKRMAALFRLLRQLATVMIQWRTRSIQDLFRFVRCQVRFKDTILQPSAQRDADALIADSDEDKLMIRCVEECCKVVGYVILRALAAIREYGSPIAKNMGLFAILQSNDTLQDFISLVNLLYLDTRLYMQKKYSALIVFKQQANQEAQLLHRFANLPIQFPCDLDPNMPKYSPQYDLYVFNDELATEQKMFADHGQWNDMIRYSRMQKQSILHRSTRPPIETPSDLAPEDVDREMKKVAKHRNLDIRELELLCIPGDSLQLDLALDDGSPLYRSAFDVLQNVGTALGMPGGHDMFNVMQRGFVRRVKFIEAVMLRTAIDHVYAARSDARSAIMKSCSDLLQTDLDFLVMSIHNEE